MMKKLMAVAVLIAFNGTLVAHASDTVAFSGNVGMQKVLDNEALYLLQAAVANPEEIKKLVAGGFHIGRVEVKVVASENPDIYSDSTVYTFTAYETRSPLQGFGGPAPRVRMLVLSAYFDKRIADNISYTWQSSGVLSPRSK